MMNHRNVILELYMTFTFKLLFAKICKQMFAQQSVAHLSGVVVAV